MCPRPSQVGLQNPSCKGLERAKTPKNVVGESCVKSEIAEVERGPNLRSTRSRCRVRFPREFEGYDINIK